MYNLLNLSLPLLGISELTGDMVLVVKIFTLLGIYAFVTQNMGKSAVAVIIMVVISWFVIFDYFAFFGGIYVLYIMMALGFSGTIIDFLFVNQQSGGGEKHPGAPNAGKDIMARQQQIRRMGR